MNIIRIIYFTALSLISDALFASVDEQMSEQADNAYQVQQNVEDSKGSWLTVPIPLSNPTIGSGLQLVLLYLHPKGEGDESPNATSGLVTMYTNTESSLLGGFHDGNWNNDLYRYRLMIGKGDFNLDYYGIGSDSPLADNPVAYSLNSDMLFTQVLRRIPGTQDWYIGFRYLYIKSNATFFINDLFPGLPPVSDDMKNSGLGLMTSFDSRNDNYYPTSGMNYELIWMRDSKSLGSDFDFDKLDTRYSAYLPVAAKSTLALSAVFSKANGDIPFYLLPSLKMRGFANGLYRDENMMSLHTELRHKFTSRWGVIFSVEAGSTAAAVSDLFSTTIYSYGAGIRWQVTADKKLNLGVDVGYSDDNRAVYVQVGERF